MKFVQRNMTENVNVSKGSDGVFFLKHAVILAAIFLGVYLLLIAAVDFLIYMVPQKVDTALTALYQSKIKTSEEWEPARQQIQNTLDQLALFYQGPPHDFKVHIVEHPVINAFALPGGNIVITDQMVKILVSKNELAMVLGHELGHYRHHDHLRALGHSAVLAGLAVLWSAGTNGNRLGDLFVRGLSIYDLKYSRQQERLADEYGLGLLIKLFGHAQGAVSVFKKMKEDADLRSEKKTAGFFSTHPLTQDRIQYLNDFIRDHQYAVWEPEILILPLAGVSEKNGNDKNIEP